MPLFRSPIRVWTSRREGSITLHRVASTVDTAYIYEELADRTRSTLGESPDSFRHRGLYCARFLEATEEALGVTGQEAFS